MTKQGPKISIIVPVYGVEKYLRQCMNSILCQTLKDIEIILIDDGSKDNCPHIIDEYAQKDDRIIAIHKKNTGYGDSCNTGINIAKGEYIGIVEPDDWIEPDMYETLYQLAKQHDADMVKSDYFRYLGLNQTNRKAHIISSRLANRVIRPLAEAQTFTIPPTIWTGLYKRDFINHNDIRLLSTPGASFQDLGFHCKTLLQSKKAYFIKKPFYHYRTDNAGSSAKDQSKIFCVCDEWTEIIAYAEKKGIDKKGSSLLRPLQYETYMWNWKRLSGAAKKRFLMQFSEEFKSLFDQGLIDKKLFKTKQYLRLQQIIFHPKWFSACYYVEHLPKMILGLFKW